MIHNNRVLCVIPARGGSKGLPGKNIASLCSKPLIAWTLEAATQSQHIDEVYVSTDSDKIAQIVEDWGVPVPDRRPAALATDTSNSVDVVLNAIDRCRILYKHDYQLVCMLEPTSPLRDAIDVDAAFEQLMAHAQAKSIVGVSESEAGHPDFSALMQDGLLRPLTGNTFVFKRRQEISKVFFFEGSLYISDVAVLQKKKTFYHDKTLGYVVPRWKALEIDDLCDLIMGEALMEAKLKGVFR